MISLIALKAEDHYLRITTDGGSALILMKFDDALTTLNGYPGIQTHRSWWLAYSQLQHLKIITFSVSLQDGTKVPISRRRKKAVQLFVEEFKASNI
ncbi:LytTR family DNA-binding domain-containing protein [Arenicella sp. 4NH20-0111]|uniref:LytTR family DNA-binding domain-containing protein n=1 Tax=Arenicella sp. 4NH20-0111 TaxID=3127648 RepID=UPI00334247C6